MIAVDTNLLVYAHRKDSPWHQPANAAIRSLWEGAGSWALLWPCLHEFFGIATHPRLYRPASTILEATTQIDEWMSSPSVSTLGETDDYWPHLSAVLTQSKIIGPKVHDARIAALCHMHGVRELWTADRDFSQFAGLGVRNPLPDY